jgi:hypothetical protein
VAQDAQPPEAGPQRDAALDNVLNGGKISALRIGVVAVDIAAENEAALVGLADVESARRRTS